MGAIKLTGSSSGSTTITAPATGGDETIELSTALAAKADTASLVPGGLVYITSGTANAASSISVNGCFTATYSDYRIVASLTTSTNADIRLRLRGSGTDNSSAVYDYADQYFTAAASGLEGGTAAAYLSLAFGLTGLASGAWDILGPAATYLTTTLGMAKEGNNNTKIHGGRMTVTTAYDGFTLYPGSGTFSGTVAVYGYRKA